MKRFALFAVCVMFAGSAFAFGEDNPKVKQMYENKSAGKMTEADWKTWNSYTADLAEYDRLGQESPYNKTEAYKKECLKKREAIVKKWSASK